MSLLLQPIRLKDEGPSGYRFRLAAANMISVRQLAALEREGVLDEDGRSFGGLGGEDPEVDGLGVWVRRWARFCPGCVAPTRTWPLSWEILFADACPHCGLWLIDSCGRCDARTDWNREVLHQCGCGQIMSAEPGRLAPTSVVRLSGALADIANGEPPQGLPVLSGLSLEQSVRLVLLLGAYGTWDGSSVPQKEPNLDQFDVSWPITSYAAEVLSNWPDGMTSLLEHLRKTERVENPRKLGKAFGGFYPALYKAFGAPEFAFLRSAFEDYVADHWSGPVAKRNRRLDASVLDALAWIPANHACRQLKVSRRRLKQLVEDGRLKGELRRSSTGREFLMVLKADVIRIMPTLNGGPSLVEVAERLGLKRQRLSGLLPTICPEAEKFGAVGCPWSIPEVWVTRWESLLQAQQRQLAAGEGCVSLEHMLRYWPWTDDQIGRLLVDVLGSHDHAAPVGVVAGARGLGGLLFDLDRAKQWFADRQQTQQGDLTIPTAAIKFEVKQEVVYGWVRAGLLEAVARRVGRRAEQRISSAALTAFQWRYVLGRDVAQVLGRSPRAVAAFMASEGVVAVAGPGIDTSRQLLFCRVAVDDCLRRSGLAK